MNKAPSPIIPKATTPIPIIAPPVKEIFNALEIDVLAACAVLKLALVAMRMPKKPAVAENVAPTMKAKIMNGEDLGSFQDKAPNKIAAITTKIASILYSDFKKDIAPRAM